MKRKGKRRKRRSSRHATARANGIVLSPLRLAFEATLVTRLDRGWHRILPTTLEAIDRLTNGRACKSLVGHWLTGRRRAPAWFVAVLASELQARRDHIDCVLADLATVQTGDKRRSPEARARARGWRMRQLGRPLNEGGGAPGIDESANPSPGYP
jgi:hypothetical protein